MFVRHLAWLHAKPDTSSKKSRLASFKALDDNHPLLELPDIESEHGAGYIIGLLQEAGLMSSTGMGPVPLSWGDIESWLRCTERELPIWLKLELKRLSEEYVYELVQAGDEKNRPAPYTRVVVAEDESELVEQRAQVQNKLLDFLSRFRRKAPEVEQEPDGSKEDAA